MRVQNQKNVGLPEQKSEDPKNISNDVKETSFQEFMELIHAETNSAFRSWSPSILYWWLTCFEKNIHKNYFFTEIIKKYLAHEDNIYKKARVLGDRSQSIANGIKVPWYGSSINALVLEKFAKNYKIPLILKKPKFCSPQSSIVAGALNYAAQVQLDSLPFENENPRYFVDKKRTPELYLALTKLLGLDYDVQCKSEILEEKIKTFFR